jgi:hypothetical protein
LVASAKAHVTEIKASQAVFMSEPARSPKLLKRLRAMPTKQLEADRHQAAAEVWVVGSVGRPHVFI